MGVSKDDLTNQEISAKTLMIVNDVKSADKLSVTVKIGP